MLLYNNNCWQAHLTLQLYFFEEAWLLGRTTLGSQQIRIQVILNLMIFGPNLHFTCIVVLNQIQLY